MKFVISRSSDICGEEYPCEESKKTKLEDWDTRYFTEQTFNKKFKEKWRDKGKNHKKINNGKYISREIGNIVGYTIEIGNLEELLNLFRKYGDLVITTRNNKNPEEEEIVIEIYDGYRE